MKKSTLELLTEFDPVTHTYRAGYDLARLEVWPSVTQLLNEFKLIDFSDVPPERLENKRILGTRVHLATVLVDAGTFDEETARLKFPEILPYLEGYRRFRQIETFEPLYKEQRYFSRKWKFAGTPDENGFHICQHGKDTALIDYKCTWACYPATGPQLSGYEILIEECLGIKIKKRYALMLKPTGHYDLIPFKDPNDKQDFLACLWLWWQRVNKYKTLKPAKGNGNGQA